MSRSDTLVIVGTVTASLFAGAWAAIATGFMNRKRTASETSRNVVEAEVAEADGIVTLSDQTVSLTMRVVELSNQITVLQAQMEARNTEQKRMSSAIEALANEVHGLRAELAEAGIEPRTPAGDWSRWVNPPKA